MKKNVIIVGIILIIGFLILRKRSIEKPVAPAENRVAAVSPVLPRKTQLIEAPAQISSSSSKENDKLTKQKTLYNLLVVSGLVEIPTKAKGEALEVQIIPTPDDSACRTGDFDLMKRLAITPSTKFLSLSVESIGNNRLKKQEPYSVLDLINKKTNSVLLPPSDGAYGVYICTDNSGKGLCSRKEPMNKKIWDAVNGGNKSAANDRILYFQMLYMKDSKLYLVPGDDWGSEALSKLQNRLRQIMGDDVEHLRYMNRLAAAIQSMSARVSSSALELPLGYLGDKCS
ncbi:MAG: hypothetical protein EOP04_06850 [Proteobacteria bacterium]|nr:MAG: hypothetical protein EOP04_06850 [Pseudomonadota bacterium]